MKTVEEVACEIWTKMEKREHGPRNYISWRELNEFDPGTAEWVLLVAALVIALHDVYKGNGELPENVLAALDGLEL